MILHSHPIVRRGVLQASLVRRRIKRYPGSFFFVNVLTTLSHGLITSSTLAKMNIASPADTSHLLTLSIIWFCRGGLAGVPDPTRANLEVDKFRTHLQVCTSINIQVLRGVCKARTHNPQYVVLRELQSDDLCSHS